MKTLAVFISGTGTNLCTIAIFCRENPHLAKIGVVISNKPNVGGLEIAKEFDIPSIVIPTKSRAMAEFEEEASKHLQNVDLICLAGFMRVLTPEFTHVWAGKMINIHPSLLPAFKGADAIGDALSHGVKITGCTVHYVTAEIDSGAIISQKAVEISDGETRETLKLKMQNAERLAYHEALMKIL